MDDPAEERCDASDARLLQLSRDGDRRAFSELWRRHAPVALAYARSLGGSPPDSEDLVSEAFISILRMLRTGGGPEERLRPYLLTTIKNLRLSALRRMPATVSIDEIEHPPSTVGAIDVDAIVDSEAIAEAFRSLPERWQHALWLSEVEQLPPRVIAEALAIRPNSAAALTYRARAALRKAWIRAQLRRAPAGTEHAEVIELLGAYAYEELSPRAHRLVTHHLETCSTCRDAAEEARHLAQAIMLGPLLAGVGSLVIASTLLSSDIVAAAPPIDGVSPPVAPQVLEATGHAASLLWPVAATVAAALSIGGSLLLRLPPETEPLAPPTAAVPTAPVTPPPEWPPLAPSPSPSAPILRLPALPAGPVTSPSPSTPSTPSAAPRPTPTPTPTPPQPTQPPQPTPGPGPGQPRPVELPPAGEDETRTTETEGPDGTGRGIPSRDPGVSSLWLDVVSHRGDDPPNGDSSPPPEEALVTVSFSVTSVERSRFLVLIDEEVVWSQNSPDGYISGTVQRRLTAGRHVVSLRRGEDDGALGPILAQTVVDVDET